jgi:hypothetical protein
VPQAVDPVFQHVVALLVNEDARWITGQNIQANGGLI